MVGLPSAAEITLVHTATMGPGEADHGEAPGASSALPERPQTSVRSHSMHFQKTSPRATEAPKTSQGDDQLWDCNQKPDRQPPLSGDAVRLSPRALSAGLTAVAVPLPPEGPVNRR